MLQKASRDFLVLSGILFSSTALALFLYTDYLLDSELGDELRSKFSFVEEELRNGNDVPSIPPIIVVEPTESIIPETIRDTMIYDLREDELELFRELSKSTVIGNKVYSIKVRTPVVESEDILGAIAVSFFSILAVVFFILFFVNKNRNRRLWEPFFHSLNQLKSFKLESHEELAFEDSNVEEFRDLNRELKQITAKLRTDYQNLKQFTADVSHETQTPLAIIQAKIDNIISQNSITEAQFEELTIIQKEIKRLSQLNSNLILLAKIDNRQFPETKEIDLRSLLEEKVEHFSSLTDKELIFSSKSSPKIAMNPLLTHVLLNNLLTNAIKYGHKKKPVFIVLSVNELTIKNYGESHMGHPEKIFERFYTEGRHPKGTGLGLSIVKKICDHYGLHLGYSFLDDQHIFKIRF